MEKLVKAPEETPARVEGNENASEATLNQDAVPSVVMQCDWEGTLSQYLEAHRVREYCLRNVECLLGECGMVLCACDLESHQQNDCLYRMVTCPDCQMEEEHHHFWMHNATCPEKLVSCENCGEDMKRKELGGNEHARRPTLSLCRRIHWTLPSVSENECLL